VRNNFGHFEERYVFIFLLALAAASSANNEANSLGLRLARTSGIVTLAPVMVKKDITDLSKEDVTLSSSQRELLLQIGREESASGIRRLVTALGASYAQHISVEDLRVLVRQNESAEAIRRRAVEPQVILDAMRSLGEMDLKKSIAMRMCKETKKLCQRH
jgi:hypothetical protein